MDGKAIHTAIFFIQAYELEEINKNKVNNILTLTDLTLHFSCCFTEILHHHSNPLLKSFTDYKSLSWYSTDNYVPLHYPKKKKTKEKKRYEDSDY